MGWLDEDRHGGFHEGYFVGLIETERGSRLFSELSYVSERDRPDLHERAPIKLEWICVACDCGWRSPRMFAPSGTDWTPHVVWLAHTQSHEVQEAYEETGRKMWRRHVAEINEIGRPMLHMDQDELRAAVKRREVQVRGRR